MYRIIYQRVTARGASHDPEEMDIDEKSVIENCKHQKVWNALAKLLDAKYRAENTELPEITGDASIRIMGYKRPGDESWHQWEQDLFAPDAQRSKTEVEPEQPMAQGVEMSDGRRAPVRVQSEVVNPAVPAKHHGSANNKNQNKRKSTQQGVKRRRGK